LPAINQVVSLQEVLQLSNIAAYNKRATGENFDQPGQRA